MFSLPSRASAAGHDSSRDVLYTVAVHICQNCGQPADRLSLVPEFEYLGCDECLEEALKQIARGQAQPKPARKEIAQSELPEVA